MTQSSSLSGTLDLEADSSQREPWWFLLWMLWGGICAGIIHYADQTAAAPIVWLLASAVVGYFGQPIMAAVTLAVCRVQEALFGLSDRPPARAGDESAVAYAARCELAALDPSRRPWAALLPTVLVVAPVHGVLIGSVVGAMVPAFSPVPGTALEGALVGLVAGPAACVALYGLVMLMVIAWPKGPAVDEAQRVVAAAAREADRQGVGYVGAGHLFVAALENAEGAAANVLKARTVDADKARAAVAAATPAPAGAPQAAGGGRPSAAEVPVEAAGLGDALQEAVRQARKFRDEAVGPGHLLLGLLAEPTPAVRRALETAELDPKGLRDELYDEMRPD